MWVFIWYQELFSLGFNFLRQGLQFVGHGLDASTKFKTSFQTFRSKRTWRHALFFEIIHIFNMWAFIWYQELLSLGFNFIRKGQHNFVGHGLGEYKIQCGWDQFYQSSCLHHLSKICRCRLNVIKWKYTQLFCFFFNNIHIQYLSVYQIPKICQLEAAYFGTLRDQFQDILATPVQLTDE